jgi:hypothetical protein
MGKMMQKKLPQMVTGAEGPNFPSKKAATASTRIEAFSFSACKILGELNASETQQARPTCRYHAIKG